MCAHIHEWEGGWWCECCAQAGQGGGSGKRRRRDRRVLGGHLRGGLRDSLRHWHALKSQQAMHGPRVLRAAAWQARIKLRAAFRRVGKYHGGLKGGEERATHLRVHRRRQVAQLVLLAAAAWRGERWTRVGGGSVQSAEGWGAYQGRSGPQALIKGENRLLNTCNLYRSPQNPTDSIRLKPQSTEPHRLLCQDGNSTGQAKDQ